jgi:hypothetical protein
VLGASPAEATSISQFCKACHGRPVQLNITSRQFRDDLSPFFDIFIDDPPKDLCFVGWAVNFLISAGDIDRASIAAGLASNTAFEGLGQGLPEKPIIILRKQLPEACEETFHQFFFLFMALWLGKGKC